MKRWLYLMSIVAGMTFCPGAAFKLSADSVIVSQYGIWGSGVDCPPVYCNAPGDSWRWQFAMSMDPVTESYDLGTDFVAVITNFQFSDNGTPIDSLANTQTEVTFYSTLECGGLATDDSSTINECADQLYDGDESAPTMVPGTYSAFLNPQVGGCGGEPFEPCATAAFGHIVITDVPTPTPEPSSSMLLIVPVLGLMFIIKRRQADQIGSHR